MSDNTELKNKIESAWENITKISPNDTDIADAVNEVIKKLDNGHFRIAEKNGNDWIVNQWLKKAVLISFRINDNKILADKIKYIQNAVGAVPSPFDCYLLIRSIKTLAVRMERHNNNALEIANYLL